MGCGCFDEIVKDVVVFDFKVGDVGYFDKFCLYCCDYRLVFVV